MHVNWSYKLLSVKGWLSPFPVKSMGLSLPCQLLVPVPNGIIWCKIDKIQDDEKKILKNLVYIVTYVFINEWMMEEGKGWK